MATSATTPTAYDWLSGDGRAADDRPDRDGSRDLDDRLLSQGSPRPPRRLGGMHGAVVLRVDEGQLTRLS
jgi:hypothetical protein